MSATNPAARLQLRILPARLLRCCNPRLVPKTPGRRFALAIERLAFGAYLGAIPALRKA